MKPARPASSLIVCLCASTAVAVSGCGQQDNGPAPAPPSCTAPPFAMPYSAIDPCSPETVLTATASAIFSYQPAQQRDTAEAFQAAAPLIAPACLQQIGASANVLAPITATTWARWSALHIAVLATAQITADDHPPDTGHQVSRTVAITQHPGTETPRALTIYMQAARDATSSPWLITGLEVK
jgi:hypothetical protein